MVECLVRASLIQELRISLRIPTPEEFAERLDSVLQVVYLLFNEGYLSHQGEDLVRQELCGRGDRLGELLLARPDTAQPKVHALFALMCLQAARLPARVDSQGDMLLLADQDRSLWNSELLGRGSCTSIKRRRATRSAPIISRPESPRFTLLCRVTRTPSGPSFWSGTTNSWQQSQPLSWP